MAQCLKQFTQLAAITLIAVLSSTSAAIAIESQDTKARLLADIAFQYAELGESQRSIGVLDQALRSTKAMTSRCFQANPLAKVAGGYLLVGQETQGKLLLAEAIQTAKVQEATRCSSSATSPTESLSNGAREYAEAGHLDLALELSRGLGDPITLAELAGHLAKAGQTERATEVLNQAIPLAQYIDDQPGKTQMLVVMAEYLQQSGTPEQVSLVLERSLESTDIFKSVQLSNDALLQVHSILRISKGFASIGADQQALEVLNQAVPKIRTLSSQPLPLDTVFYQIEAALQYIELEQKSQSVSILAEALATAQGIPKDQSLSQEAALGKVAEGYAKLGDFEQALQIAQSIQTVGERAAAFGQIALAYAKAGNTDAAVKLARSGGNQNATLIEIVRHYLANKQPDQAWNFVQTQQVKGILSEVALGYLEAGQPEQALKIVQIGELEGFVPDIALSHIKAGQPEQAWKLLKNKKMEWVLPEIARGFAQQKQFDSALEVTQSMNDKTYKVQALIAIAQGYIKKDLVEPGIIQGILANLVDIIRGVFGDSEREKATEVLEQALQITRSL
jgi:tetratricopeptide (TPR) repeat protein